METTICRNCEHFHLHYTLDQYQATPLDCGHCSYPRLKKRRPSAPACVHYAKQKAPKELPDREKVLSFLTVDLLEYILGLELPPEVDGD